MNAFLTRLRAGVADERGFTLIELLVATACGMIVSAATLAIVISSVHLSANYANRIDSNQQGRVAMERIAQALNSSCVSATLPPILAGTGGSDANDIVFYSSLTDKPTITPNKVEVSLVGATGAQSLVMYTYDYVSGATPSTWTFASTPSTSFVLLPHAAAVTVAGVAQPIFGYYGYATSGPLALSGTSYATPLVAADAAATARQGHHHFRGATF
jgi:type II secretory pathway pseudopilin PulG